MKTYSQQISKFLFCLFIFLTSTNIYSEEKLITFKLKANTEKILNFNSGNFGIKANTSGGKVEVRMYIADKYNFDHKRDNPALVFGFYSEGKTDLNYYYSNSWIAEKKWPSYCFDGINFLCSEASIIENRSTDVKFMRNRLKDHFFEEHYHLGFDNDFHKIAGNTIDLVLEIDYNLPILYSLEYGI